MANAYGRRPNPTTTSIDPNVMAAASETLDPLTLTRTGESGDRVRTPSPSVAGDLAGGGLEVLAVEAVNHARASDEGPTWAGVGEALGIRPQSAQQRIRPDPSEPGA
jgi:hypothetical protein